MDTYARYALVDMLREKIESGIALLDKDMAYRDADVREIIMYLRQLQMLQQFWRSELSADSLDEEAEALYHNEVRVVEAVLDPLMKECDSYEEAIQVSICKNNTTSTPTRKEYIDTIANLDVFLNHLIFAAEVLKTLSVAYQLNTTIVPNEDPKPLVAYDVLNSMLDSARSNFELVGIKRKLEY